MVESARRDCDTLDAQSAQLDTALGSLSSEAHKLQTDHCAAATRVQQAMEALKLAQNEETAAAAAKEAHMVGLYKLNSVDP